jgi:hypothetical protein
MMPDRKKSVGMIIARMKPDGEYKTEKKPEGEEDHNDMELAQEDAMRKFISSMESKDPKGMVSSLKDFIELCHEDYEEQDEEMMEG